MQRLTKVKDRYGLPISTSSTLAAEHYVDGTDLLLGWNFGSEERCVQAIEADEGFALAHSAQALMLLLDEEVAEAQASANRARALADKVSRRERQHIEAIAVLVNGEGPRALALMREHLAEFPRDALILFAAHNLLFLGCSDAGIANFPEEQLALLKSVESDYGDDWAFLSQYSFAHHETGSFEDALRLAERSLELRPTNGQASHSVAHALLERSDYTGGADFLGNWMKGYDRRAPYHVHLTWHLALFELALGRYQRVRDLNEDDIRPSVIAKNPITLADSASLLWRWQMYGGYVPPTLWEEVRDQAYPAAQGPGSAYRDAHAALAFGGAGDQKCLDRMIDRLRGLANQDDLLAGEITLPLVQGIGAFAQGSYDEAVRIMGPIFDRADLYQLVRMGGSHAQREVFEDTLLEAYLRTEQFDKAEAILRTRLGRRASIRDMYWLGRAQSGNGQAGAARANLREAMQCWQDAEQDSPEIIALNRLAEKVG